MLNEFADSPSSLDLVSLGVADKDLGIRLLAWWASSAGEQVVRGFPWDQLGDAATVQLAISFASGNPSPIPPERVFAALQIVLESPLSFIRAASLEGLGRLADRQQTGPISAARLAKETDPTVLVAGARALAKTAASAEEGVIFGLLTVKNEEVVSAAAKALGTLGTVNAVPLLRKSAEFPHLRQTEADINAAITRIQSRLKGAEAGFVSLSSISDAGQLALSAEGGELSNPTRTVNADRKPGEGRRGPEVSDWAKG